MQRGFGVFWDYCAIHNPTVVFNGKRGVESHFRRWFICTNKRKQTKYLSSPLPFPRQSLVNTEVFSSALHLWAPLTKSYPVRKTRGKIKYKIHFSDLKKIFFFPHSTLSGRVIHPFFDSLLCGEARFTILSQSLDLLKDVVHTFVCFCGVRPDWTWKSSSD